MNIKLYFSFVLLFILISSGITSPLKAQEEGVSQVIRDYDAHRQAYMTMLSKEKSRLNSEKKRINEANEKIKNEIASLENKKNKVNSSIEQTSRRNVDLKKKQNRLLKILHPLLITGADLTVTDKTTDRAIPVVFTIWAVILFIILRRFPQGDKPVRIIRWLAIPLLLSLLLMSPLLFAQEGLNKEQKLKISLDLTSDIFSMTEHGRYIDILKKSSITHVKLPNLESGSPYLKVYETIETGTGKAYFTIAALASYIGRNGEAIDALKQFSRKDLKIDPKERDYLLINTLKYLIQYDQSEAATNILNLRITEMIDSSKLVSLSKYLIEKGYQESADKALKQAIIKATKTDDLLEMGDYLFSINKQVAGKAAYEKALKNSVQPLDILSVASAWSSHNIGPTDSLLKRLTRVYRKGTRKYNRKESRSLLFYQVNLIDIFYRNKKHESAIQLFSSVLSQKESNKLNTYQELLDYALSNKWYEQATSVIQNLVKKLPNAKRFQVKIRPKVILKSEAGLPNSDELSLPVLYGLLNEEQGFDDKAVNSYINSIQQSLNLIQSNMGYNIENNLNDFYLLGRQFKSKGNEKMLSSLDETYTLLEGQILDQTKRNNTELIAALVSNADNDSIKIEKLREEIVSLENQHQKKQYQTKILMLSNFGLGLFLLTLLIGCFIWARAYSLKQSTFRLGAFMAKFIEVIGWTKVFSILGAISGLLITLIGQALQIFHRMHEELKIIRGNKPTT